MWRKSSSTERPNWHNTNRNTTGRLQVIQERYGLLGRGGRGRGGRGARRRALQPIPNPINEDMPTEYDIEYDLNAQTIEQSLLVVQERIDNMIPFPGTKTEELDRLQFFFQKEENTLSDPNHPLYEHLNFRFHRKIFYIRLVLNLVVFNFKWLSSK